ncbi:MAG: NAD(P)-binding domain-containing protein [Bdellovibrionaceae bacterium]|jgi:pyrroline-5-carboxylate reductase|nr:NAD(P)-binding domain-containing protein [Pseudobdellovibrionaceae bacterium]
MVNPKKPKLGIIGAGHLSSHLVAGLIQQAHYNPTQIFVSNRSSQKAIALGQKWGIQVVSSNDQLIESSDWVIVAVKPKDFSALADEISHALHPGQTLISLMAGIRWEQLQKRFPEQKIVRLIPNLAISLGQGVMGLYGKEEWLLKSITSVLSPLGSIYSLDKEEALDALLVSTSSGLGFVFELMTYFTDWLDSHGFAPQESRRLIESTFWAAAAMAQQSQEKELETLIQQVASKGGVTEKGLQTMRDYETDRLVRMSLDAAYARLEELARR